MAKNKEVLTAFGGSMTIEEFRKGFMTIKDLDMIERCFTCKDKSNEASITNSPWLRRMTYCFEDPKSTAIYCTSRPSIMNNKQEQQEDLGPPVVHKRVTKYKRLLN